MTPKKMVIPAVNITEEKDYVFMVGPTSSSQKSFNANSFTESVGTINCRPPNDTAILGYMPILNAKVALTYKYTCVYRGAAGINDVPVGPVRGPMSTVFIPAAP